jgi:hypothetical protein
MRHHVHPSTRPTCSPELPTLTDDPLFLRGPLDLRLHLLRYGHKTMIRSRFNPIQDPRGSDHPALLRLN